MKNYISVSIVLVFILCGYDAKCMNSSGIARGVTCLEEAPVLKGVFQLEIEDGRSGRLEIDSGELKWVELDTEGNVIAEGKLLKVGRLLSFLQSDSGESNLVVGRMLLEVVKEKPAYYEVKIHTSDTESLSAKLNLL